MNVDSSFLVFIVSIVSDRLLSRLHAPSRKTKYRYACCVIICTFVKMYADVCWRMLTYVVPSSLARSRTRSRTLSTIILQFSTLYNRLHLASSGMSGALLDTTCFVSICYTFLLHTYSSIPFYYTHTHTHTHTLLDTTVSSRYFSVSCSRIESCQVSVSICTFVPVK